MPGRQKRTKRCAIDFTSVITIYVGKDAKKFVLHQDLLVAHSQYFRSALQGPWLEAASREFNHVADDPLEFDIFTHWLYYKELKEEASSMGAEMLLQLWILGDKLLAPSFQNAVIDNLITLYDEEAPLMDAVMDSVNEIYERTKSTSPLRSFTVDVFASDGEPDNEFGDRLQVLNDDFRRDLTLALMTYWNEMEEGTEWGHALTAKKYYMPLEDAAPV